MLEKKVDAVKDRAQCVLALKGRAQKNLFTLAGTHARSGNQLVCVKPRQTDVIDSKKNHLNSGIHGDTVSTHLAFSLNGLSLLVISLFAHRFGECDG